MTLGATRNVFTVNNYDLDATLASGQSFRWKKRDGSWEGIIAARWVRLHSEPGRIIAETAVPQSGWQWLSDYLQPNVPLDEILATFPDDEPMRAAVRACRGLRLLRQDPWECLASFICSSNKQIVQIQQIISLLCDRHGEPVVVPPGCDPARAFPDCATTAALTEADLRACKMGFRAPYVLASARRLQERNTNLAALSNLTLADARAELLQLPGVGPKIADCVLLFAHGFPTAFPVDVWILRALQRLYFPRRRVNPARLRRFVETHFGPHAGYAQQYLFHYARAHGGTE